MHTKPGGDNAPTPYQHTIREVVARTDLAFSPYHHPVGDTLWCGTWQFQMLVVSP